MAIRKANVGCEIVIGQLLGILIVVGLLALWTGRSLDYLCSYYAGHAVHVPYWLDFLFTFVFNGVILLFNVVVEIIRLFA